MKVRDTKQGHIWILALILVMVLSVSTVSIAQVAPSMESAKIGIRGGVGTDINGRLAYGIGGNYLIDLQSNALELGILFFVAGIGLGSINVEREERSPTDESLGALLPGGGSI